MKTLLAATVVMSLGAASAPALAAPALSGPLTGYATFGYSYLDSNAAKLGQLDGRLGLRYGRYVGVEGQLSQGVKSDDTTVNGVKTTVKAQPSASAYVVGYVPLSDRADLFARVGYGASQFRDTTVSDSHSFTDHSVNYGVGGQYFFDAANGVRGDYTREDFHGSHDDANVWSVAYVRRF